MTLERWSADSCRQRVAKLKNDIMLHPEREEELENKFFVGLMDWRKKQLIGATEDIAKVIEYNYHLIHEAYDEAFPDLGPELDCFSVLDGVTQ